MESVCTSIFWKYSSSGRHHRQVSPKPSEPPVHVRWRQWTSAVLGFVVVGPQVFAPVDVIERSLAREKHVRKSVPPLVLGQSEAQDARPSQKTTSHSHDERRRCVLCVCCVWVVGCVLSGWGKMVYVPHALRVVSAEQEAHGRVTEAPPGMLLEHTDGRQQPKEPINQLFVTGLQPLRDLARRRPLFTRPSHHQLLARTDHT
jgi:hypothetical protein